MCVLCVVERAQCGRESTKNKILYTHARKTYIRLAERCALFGGRWCSAADETRVVVMPIRWRCRRSCRRVGQTVRRGVDGTRRPVGRPTATLVSRCQSMRPLFAVARPSKGRLGEKNQRVVGEPRPSQPTGRVARFAGPGKNASVRRPTHVLRLRSFRPWVTGVNITVNA